MRIIGIRIYGGGGNKAKCPPEVMKGLKPGWFPFGNFIEPIHSGDKWILDCSIPEDKMYNLFDKTGEVIVSGIVGKNGSGKSTILDFLLMILNNVAYYLLSDQFASDETKPKYVYGVFAKLYIETNHVIKRIKCMNKDVFYSNGEKDCYLPSLGDIERKRIVSDLFYTVLCNYGAYSLNSTDYDVKINSHGKKGKGYGAWLRGIFDLAQNYIYPITITPQRHGGNFDVNQIKDEAMEKLIALMMYSKFHGYSFMPGYNPSRISYRYDESLRSDLTNTLYSIAKGKNVAFEDLTLIKSAIIAGWAKYLDCEDLYTQDRFEESEEIPNELFLMLLEYCACQTVHLCVYYDRFRRNFDIIGYLKNLMKNNEKINFDSIPKVYENVLYLSIEHDYSNITYGIRKCMLTIRETKQRGLAHMSFLKKRGNLPIAKFALPENSTIEKVLNLLPPPIFKMDVLLKKDMNISEDDKYAIDNNAGEILISKLSSGEKQWLYSLTTALFHIKYIEDTIASTKDMRYEHVLLLFDEAELYYHPEYQRKFVYNLLRYISWLNLVVIKSIQIVIATHSPFILSDLMKDNILFMREG